MFKLVMTVSLLLVQNRTNAACKQLTAGIYLSIVIASVTHATGVIIKIYAGCKC